jgi:hypothetical protein
MNTMMQLDPCMDIWDFEQNLPMLSSANMTTLINLNVFITFIEGIKGVFFAFLAFIVACPK